MNDAAVVALPHEIDWKHPIAFIMKKRKVAMKIYIMMFFYRKVVMKNSHVFVLQVTEGKLKQIVAKKLENYNYLRGGIVFIDGTFPYLINERIDRQILRNMARVYKKDTYPLYRFNNNP